MAASTASVATDPANSRGVMVLGMHRSGTSAITRGMQALGFHLGSNFLETRFDNPTGYWEDKAIVGLQDRLLGAFGMTWEDAALIDDARWNTGEVELFVKEARFYLTDHLLPYNPWAFKDPRSIRLLPLWQRVVRELASEVRYLLIVRNPLSVVASLQQRQAMPPEHAYRLWLAYLVPYLDLLFDQGLLIVDYDLFMDAPVPQLCRIAQALEVPVAPVGTEAFREYGANFLQQELRHNRFDEAALAESPDAPDLCKEAYRWLRRWAVADPAPIGVQSDNQWAQLVQRTRALLATA